MQYSRCKCGTAERWCSGYPIHDCEGCEICGTTLAFGASTHKPLQPHTWQKIEDVKVVDGVEEKRTVHEQCKVCGARK